MLRIDNDSTFPQLLLTVELAGATYYFAERGPVSIQVDGVDTLFHGGIQISSFKQEADLFGTSAVSRQVSVLIDLTSIVDLPTLLAGGVALYAGRASVYQYAGGTFDDVSRVASGRITSPTYADPAAPNFFGFTVDRDLTERAYTHPVGARVRANAFRTSIPTSDTPSTILGKYYPIPIGRPGVWIDGLIDYTTAYPAVPACYGITPATTTDYRIVVSYGRVGATEAHVWINNNYKYDVGLLTATDDYGNFVTYLDLSAGGEELHLANINVALKGEGVASTLGEEFRGLGDVIVWALSKSSLAKSGDIDWSRQLALVDELNALGRVDTYIAERVKVLDWLLSDILAYFPIFTNDAGDGLYVDVWRYDATDEDVEVVIDVDVPGYERRSAVGYEEGTPVSVITVNGHQSLLNDAFLETVNLSGDPIDAADTSYASDSRLAKSFQLFDLNELSIDVPTVQDRATLAKLATYYAYKYALPRAVVAYAVPWRKVNPRIGMVASINDSAAGLSGSRGIVRGFEYVDGELVLSISLV